MADPPLSEHPTPGRLSHARGERRARREGEAHFHIFRRTAVQRDVFFTLDVSVLACFQFIRYTLYFKKGASLSMVNWTIKAII